MRPLDGKAIQGLPAFPLGTVDEQFAVQPQDVEGNEGDRRVGQQPGGRLGDMHPPLEALKARHSLLVERDDLAVEHRRVRCDRLTKANELRIVAGDLAAPAVRKHDAVLSRDGDHPLPVKLGFKLIAGRVGRDPVAARQHRQQARRRRRVHAIHLASGRVRRRK